MFHRREYYYHYTTREARRFIFREGIIKAGRFGSVYLSPVRYHDARTAMEELGIVDKVVECGILIRGDLIPEGVAESTIDRVVDPNTGQILRRGGGLEIVLDNDLLLPISTFGLP